MDWRFDFEKSGGLGRISATLGAGLLPVPLAQAMMGTAILDIVIGAFLLINFLPWIATLVGSVHLIVILIVSGITDITVRDIGLLAEHWYALMIDSPPPIIIRRIFRNNY